MDFPFTTPRIRDRIKPEYSFGPEGLLILYSVQQRGIIQWHNLDPIKVAAENHLPQVEVLLPAAVAQAAGLLPPAAPKRSPAVHSGGQKIPIWFAVFCWPDWACFV